MLVGCLACTLPLERLGAGVLASGRRLGLTLLVAGTPFLCWDLYATAAGHWSFDADQTLGVSVAGLPLEEIAFFVVIPLAIVLSYEAVRAVRRGFGR